MAFVADVPQFDIYDFSLDSVVTYDDPLTVNVFATLEHKSGERIENVSGFYNGGTEWVIRFSPTLLGRWSGETKSSKAELSGKKIEIQCVKNENPNIHGALQIDPDHPQKFTWEDGTPFIILGFEIIFCKSKLFFSIKERRDDGLRSI